MYNVDAYIILVDRNFLVEKTNYYNLNNTSEGQVLRRVGDEDKRKVMSRGFNGYLSKPLNKEALFDMLRQMGI